MGSDSEQRVSLGFSLPRVLGVGAYLKNCPCLIDGKTARLLGPATTLDQADAIRAFEAKGNALRQAAGDDLVLAHDWHPDFPSTRWALQSGLRCIGIQHHHAHIAAVMAEHGLRDAVLGLALDGFGLGTDRQSWGGELLVVDASGFRRLGHLKPLLQPGGDRAAREIWRMGAAALWDLGRKDSIAGRYNAFAGSAMLAGMMDKGLHCPPTTSAGRLFDAACGLMGIHLVSHFEGQAPMEFEKRVRAPAVLDDGYRLLKKDGLWVLDMGPLLAFLSDLAHDNTGLERGADLFHGTLVAGLLDMAARAAQETGLRHLACAGGCFFNAPLTQGIGQGAKDKGLTPLFHKQLGPGDASLALGQAYAAALLIAGQQSPS